MLYWKDNVDLEYCKFYGDARYKPSRGRDPHRKKSPYVILRYLPLTPCLQRLYSSRKTVDHMTWHATHQTEERSICHQSDAKAWKHFNLLYLDFAEEQHNVRMGLCINDFALHEPLIEELLQLWHVGVRTYDHATDNTFIIRAALMWIVNNLPAMGWRLGGVPPGYGISGLYR
ncbi:UNVERIFIED_CONTAM: hypothetical protein Scaly_2433600 [Sesamum calycinum]|uniref:Uncharacterized protein n=1 Tax=Sesamum calycinum TaxID=2727403 RepID=A0AAW2LZT3_9LAMI